MTEIAPGQPDGVAMLVGHETGVGIMVWGHPGKDTALDAMSVMVDTMAAADCDIASWRSVDLAWWRARDRAELIQMIEETWVEDTSSSSTAARPATLLIIP